MWPENRQRVLVPWLQCIPKSFPFPQEMPHSVIGPETPLPLTYHCKISAILNTTSKSFVCKYFAKEHPCHEGWHCLIVALHPNM